MQTWYGTRKIQMKKNHEKTIINILSDLSAFNILTLQMLNLVQNVINEDKKLKMLNIDLKKLCKENGITYFI